MYNSDRRYHLLLGQPEAPAHPAEDTAIPSRQRALWLPAILEALSRIAEVRTLPFGGLSAPYAADREQARNG